MSETLNIVNLADLRTREMSRPSDLIACGYFAVATLAQTIPDTEPLSALGTLIYEDAFGNKTARLSLELDS